MYDKCQTTTNLLTPRSFIASLKPVVMSTRHRRSWKMECRLLKRSRWNRNLPRLKIQITKITLLSAHTAYSPADSQYVGLLVTVKPSSHIWVDRVASWFVIQRSSMKKMVRRGWTTSWSAQTGYLIGSATSKSTEWSGIRQLKKGLKKTTKDTYQRTRYLGW